MTRDLTAVDSSVVVQELELAMNLALYGLLWSLGNQYIVGSLSRQTYKANHLNGYKRQSSHQ